MNAAAILPWYVVLFTIFGGEPGIATMPGYWYLLMVFLCAVLWESRAGARSDQNPRRRRTVSLLVGVGGLLSVGYMLVPAELRSFIRVSDYVLSLGVTLGYLWIQGTTSAYEDLDERLLRRKMIQQMCLCAAGLVAATLSGAMALPGVATVMVVAVIGLATGYLVLLMLVRDEELREGQRELGKTVGYGTARPWVGGSVLVILSGTALASAFVQSHEFRQLISTLLLWLSKAYDFGFAVASLILLRWHQMLWWIANPRFMPKLGFIANIEGDMEDLWQASEQGEMLDPNSLLPYYTAILYVFAALLLGFFLYRMRDRRRHRLYADGEEERHSLGLWNSLLTDLRSILDRRAGQVVAYAPEEAFDPAHPRMIYRRLLSWGERQGRPRGGNETETSYGSALVREAGAPPDSVAIVTSLYQRSRYAEEAVNGERVRGALAAMQLMERIQKE